MRGSAPHAALNKDEFKSEVVAWAKRISVRPAEIHVRLMKRKRGSCSTGPVALNSELLTVAEDLRPQVIVEELLHLRLPNHGKLFKALKKAYLADPADKVG